MEWRKGETYRLIHIWNRFLKETEKSSSLMAFFFLLAWTIHTNYVFVCDFGEKPGKTRIWKHPLSGRSDFRTGPSSLARLLVEMHARVPTVSFARSSDVLLLLAPYVDFRNWNAPSFSPRPNGGTGLWPDVIGYVFRGNPSFIFCGKILWPKEWPLGTIIVRRVWPSAGGESAKFVVQYWDLKGDIRCLCWAHWAQVSVSIHISFARYTKIHWNNHPQK